MNAAELDQTPERADALAIIEAAYAAIDTESLVRTKLVLDGNNLTTGNRSFDIAVFKRVRLFGFGKASCKAVETVEKILRSHVTEGIAIDVRPGACEVVEVTQGSHPQPSAQNVAASAKVVEMAKDGRSDDLVIIVVSGGGSSLLCYPENEREQGVRLYADAMRRGATIDEMNMVRKHLSAVKGGGLAALFSPATVIGLIFCDVPGDHFKDVASGPTYFDESTIADAQKMLGRYGLSGYTLNETPKDHSLFERVYNVEMVSNTVALAAMRTAAEALGYRVVDAGSARYDAPAALVESMLSQLDDGVAVIAGGEVRLEVTGSGGSGGRCQYVGLEALKRIGEHDVFVPFASDGRDNCDMAGVIVDTHTRQKARDLSLSIDARLADFNTYPFFKTTGDLIQTGFTDANVSDLYFVLRKTV